MKFLSSILILCSLTLIFGSVREQEQANAEFTCHLWDENSQSLSLDITDISVNHYSPSSSEQIAWQLNHANLKIDVNFENQAIGFYIDETGARKRFAGYCEQLNSI